MNTLVVYMYRDTANYKTHESVTLLGELTPAQIEEIWDCCDRGENFLAAQVGLPELQIRFPPSEDDHVWHELIEIKLTDQRAYVGDSLPTADEFYLAFVATRESSWDEQGAMQRLGFYHLGGSSHGDPPATCPKCGHIFGSH